jgi:acetoacetyl-CoA reductase/3-oxoacyl-[acyl-carrier protein] reductase
MFGLEGKVVLVTGGNRGIGAAVVKFLEEQGAKVAYNYRSEPGPTGTLPIQADITDLAQMEAMVKRIESELGPIYGVVANAGITRDGLFTRLSPEAWSEVITANLTGVYNTLTPILPGMNERKSGSVVIISSIVGEHGNVGQSNYAAAKAGLLGLGKTLSLEGARYGVRTNVVCPGFTSTDMLKPIPDKVKDKIVQTIPLRRFAEPVEIAYASAFLLSPTLSAYITGQTLSVDGGRHT